jgi:hypothetical protein
VQGAPTASARSQAYPGLSLLNNDLLDVGKPKPPSMSLGMANPVAKLGSFSANITLDWHSELPLSYVDVASTNAMIAQEPVFCKFYTQAKEHVHD